MSTKTDIYLNDAKFNDLIDEIDKLNLFQNNIHFYLFAGSLGFSKKDKVESSKKGQGKEINVATNKTLKDYQEHIRSIAVASTGDVTILNDLDRCYEEFSQYVNGGLAFIDDLYDKNPKPEDFIDEIISLVNRQAIKNLKKKGEK